MTIECLACGSRDITDLADLGDSPALSGILWEDTESAHSAARGRLRLATCSECGHVQNVAFDEALVDYDGDYDISLHFSPTFQAFADELVEQLAASYDLSGRHVVEIGSGKGEFLVQLCERTGAVGTGYDPSYTGESESTAVSFRAEYFPIGEQPPPFDLLVARHVLEHLADPAAFVTGLRAAVDGTDRVVYLEVPSAEFNFGPDGMWDCIYPHVSYFSAHSLRRAVERADFEVLDARSGFGGQFLSVEIAAPGSRPVRAKQPDRDVDLEYRRQLVGFARRFTETASSWRRRIAQIEEDGRKVVLWGAGMKGVTFLNAVDQDRRLDAVIDLNPRKWGRFVPGTGHRVSPPERLAGRDVAAVLITNPAYEAEIARQLDDLGVHADVLAV